MRRTIERLNESSNSVLAAGLFLVAVSLLLSYFLFGFVVFVLVFFAVFGVAVIYNYFLKRTSPFSTLIGAIPASFPALIGSAMAAGGITLEGILLSGIVFLWQLPHTLIISMRFKEDYEKAGVPTLFSYYGDEKGIKALYFSVLLFFLYLPLLYFFGLLSFSCFSASFLIALFLISKTLKIRTSLDSKKLSRLHWLYIFYLLALFLFIALSKFSLTLRF